MREQALATACILVVDDQDANVELLESFLEEDGYTNVVSTTDSGAVLSLFDSLRPDLILLDLHMPPPDGFVLLREITARISPEEYFPILVLTADVTRSVKERALSEGARDFLAKPLDATEVLLRIRNLLETRVLHQQQQAARQAAEAAEQRAQFLADASRVLGSSFDYATTLAQLARLAVPTLADFCVVDLLETDNTFTRLAVAHADPAQEALLLEAGPPQGVRQHPLGSVFRAGEPVLVEEVTQEQIDRYYGKDERRSVVEQLAPRSAMAIPLSVAGKLIGGITLACSTSDRCFGPEHLELATELARRAALAVDNARLFLHAREATRARDEMLAVVAHDLRNPLGAITMGSSLLLELLPAEPPREMERKHLQIIQRSAERMNTLIQDLLDVTRMETGGLVLQTRPEDIGSLMAEALAMLRPLAASRGIRLESRGCDDRLPAAADAARVLQVISNLVGNAIKFTPGGGRVELRCEAAGEEVQLAVSDTGPGIPPEQIPHLFERFWQADAADRRGVGLGLSIAYGIVQAHGGRMWVESTLGQGSTFRFVLPRGLPGAAATQGSTSAPEMSAEA